ncbi:cytochrome c biogenesis protein CcdA [Leucobacter viscericola]|uniref:Cytochrome c biogenesis protein CcdA n=1 Tax=Leucobacter viscericola TaxID=2714935 RepID=A0A6G7XH63_9MICO|nr:cytochrome c biogenesis protein CcdA [Leucobacter viscericola]QIK63727.1 cytochrome c biogenesis protein CcdA [Leucobacter viscericola]
MDLQGIVADGQLLVASLIALAAGLVSFLSPCVLPLVPGYLAYVSGVAGTASVSAADAKRAGSAERRRMFLGSILFILGFTVIFVLVNILAGSIGFWLWEWQDTLIRVMGAVVILMGLVFIGAFSKLQGTSRLKFKPRVGLLGAPLLGIVFALGWAPCMGPTLGMVVTLSAQTGSVGRAVVLAIFYCLGLGIPFVLATFGFGWMTQTMTFFKRHIRTVNLIGGGLLILIGLLMVAGVWSQIMFEMQAVIEGYVPAL